MPNQTLILWSARTQKPLYSAALLCANIGANGGLEVKQLIRARHAFISKPHLEIVSRITKCVTKVWPRACCLYDLHVGNQSYPRKRRWLCKRDVVKLHATLALTQSSGFEEAVFPKGAFHLTIALGLCSWDTSWRTVGEPLGAVYMAIRSTL